MSIAFVVLRKKEPQMDRPMRVGGKGNGGIVIGVISTVLCLFLFMLYLPVTPWSAQLAWPSWLMFGLWIAVGVALMLRLPGGVQPGPNAEAELLKKLCLQP